MNDHEPTEGHAAGAHEGAAEHGGAHHEVPLLDIDGTFFIQLTLFLILIAALRSLLFKPWLKLQAEREDRIEGEKRRATELDRKATETLADYETRIGRARQIGNEERVKRRAEAKASEAEVVGKARGEAEQILAASNQALAKQREETHIRLVASAQSLGRQMAVRILGREVTS